MLPINLSSFLLNFSWNDKSNDYPKIHNFADLSGPAAKSGTSYPTFSAGSAPSGTNYDSMSLEELQALDKKNDSQGWKAHIGSSNGALVASTDKRAVSLAIIKKQQDAFNSDKRGDYDKVGDDMRANYNARSDSNKYTGGLSVEQLNAKFAKTGQLSDKEREYLYVFSYGNKNNSLGPTSMNEVNTLKGRSNDLTDFMAKNGIKIDPSETLKIKVTAKGDFTFSGINKDTKAALDVAFNDPKNAKEVNKLASTMRNSFNNLSPGHAWSQSKEDDRVIRSYAMAQHGLERYGLSHVKIDDLSLDENGNIQGLPQEFADRLNSVTDYSRFGQNEANEIMGKYDTVEEGYTAVSNIVNSADYKLGQLKGQLTSAIKYLETHNNELPTSGDAYFTYREIGNPTGEGAPSSTDKVPVYYAGNVSGVSLTDGMGLTITTDAFSEIKDPWNYDHLGNRRSNYAAYY